jgi:hypothetical protein
LKQRWDAATTVQGAQNNDAVVDQGYTTEMKFNVRRLLYDVSQASGEVLMFNISIYDADWRWPIVLSRTYGNRAWLQGPWGNVSPYHHLRIHTNPSVTISSGTLPTVGPEITVPEAGAYPSPTLDGRLNEPVWRNASVGTMTLKYGDAGIRNGYPGTIRYRSGHFQPTVNGVKATVQDANTATVKYFHKNDTLFLGFDVADRVVQSFNAADRWDGFTVTVSQRNNPIEGAVLERRRLSFRIGGSGTTLTTVREDDIAPSSGRWDSTGVRVQVAMALKGGTTIDTVGATPDSGYTAELRVRLDSLGYPAGRGDQVVFLAVKHCRPPKSTFPEADGVDFLGSWLMMARGVFLAEF